MRLISQLFYGVSKVHQKLLKYFDGTALSTSSVLAPAGVFRVILILNTDDLGFCYIIIWIISVIFPQIS